MSKFHEAVRIFIIDTEKFLVKTIKDAKLSSAAVTDRKKLLIQIAHMRQEYAQLNLGKPLGKPELYQEEQKLDKKRKGSSSSSDTSPLDAVISSTLYKIKDKSKAAKPVSKMSGKKWAALKEDTLYVYDKQGAKKPNMTLPLTNCRACQYSENKTGLVFQISTSDKKEYYFAGQNTADVALWVEAIGKIRTGGSLTKTSDSAASTSAPDEVLYEAAGDDVAEPETYEDPEQEENLYELGDDQDMASDVSDGSSHPPPNFSPPTPPAHRGSPKVPPPRSADRKKEEVADEEEEVGEDEELYDEAFSGTPILPEPKIEESSEKEEVNPAFMKNDFHQIFYGKWSCSASDDQELAFDQGDELYVMGKEYDDDGWWVAKLGSKVGLVPKSYLSPAYKEITIQ